MGRGPSYPYVNLEEAIGLARKVYDFTRKSAAPLESVIKEAWDYSATSSSGDKVLAALKAFGLVEELASGDAKMLKISDRGYRILVDDEKSPERLTALAEAALSPKWYRFCWEKWGAEMPPSMRSNLLFEHRFVESTVDRFIEDYKKTIEFGGVLSGAEAVPTAKNSIGECKASIRIGDSVQWESQGVLQFSEPKRVRELSEDGQWAFVDGSNTGMPVNELTVVEPKTDSSPAPKVSLPPRPRTWVEAQKAAGELPSNAPGTRQDVFSLAEGQVMIQWPSVISKESFQDFSDWLKILERKIGRSVQELNSKSGE